MKKTLIIVGSAIAVATYGAFAYMRQKALIAQTSFRLKTGKVKFKSVTQMELTATYEFTNDSSFAFNIIGNTLNVYVNDKYVGRITNQQFRVEKKSSITATSSATINLLDFLGSIASGLADAKNLTVRVHGKIYVQNNIFFASIPVDFQYSVKELLENYKGVLAGL